jgi:hypothetical protein
LDLFVGSLDSKENAQAEKSPNPHSTPATLNCIPSAVYHENLLEKESGLPFRPDCAFEIKIAKHHSLRFILLAEFQETKTRNSTGAQLIPTEAWQFQLCSCRPLARATAAKADKVGVFLNLARRALTLVSSL